MKICKNKRIIAKMLKQNYWKAIKIGKNIYFRTFQDNVLYN